MLTILLGVLLAGCAPDGDADGDGYSGADDCDDKNPAVHPGAEEVCDDLDNDCDGAGDPQLTGYPDVDRDGFGGLDAPETACELPEGYVADGTDCDDGRADVYPGADETNCDDPVDYNCDGVLAFADDDGDGFTICDDCDDADPEINPGVDELCDDADRNCDGDPVAGATDATAWYTDSDGDGYGRGGTGEVDACEQPAGTVDNATDCDDEKAVVHPGGTETCGGGDEDCDGLSGSDDPDVVGTTTLYTDADGDLHGDPDSPVIGCVGEGAVSVGDDCDDTDPTVNPGLPELCAGGDEDCDGLVNDEDPSVSDGTFYYPDADGDGYGDEANGTGSCDGTGTGITVGGDCDDSDPTINPLGAEVCGGGDEDCDGLTDDDDPDVDTSTWPAMYLDEDHDGYGSLTSTTSSSCAAPIGASVTSDDCDDAEPAVSPGHSESCVSDGVDDDCDGLVDDADDSLFDGSWYFPDNDADGVGSVDEATQLCADPGAGYSNVIADCDDADASVWSGCAEPTFDETFDVIVVGTGPAGIGAALSAREMGANVLLLDKAEEPGQGILAGNGLFGAETRWQADAGVADSVDDAVADWEDITGVSGDTESVRLYIENTGATLEWLESYGLVVGAVDERDDTGPVARTHVTNSENEDGSAKLIGEFDGELRTSTEVLGPVLWGDEVVGVYWRDRLTGEIGSSGADAVVMATGGYQRDEELLLERLPAISERDWVYESILESNGGGVPFLELAGGDTINEEAVGTYAHSTRDPMRTEHENLYFYTVGGAIIVGEDGLRFNAEDQISSFGYLATMPSGDAYVIIDDAAAPDFGLKRNFYVRLDGEDYQYTVPDLYGWSDDVYWGSTLAELADATGIDEAGLTEEIDTWNDLASTGGFDAWGREPAHFGAFTGTGYYAMRLYVGVAKVFGGVSTSVDTEVLDADGVAISGLYAAGEVAGMLPGGGSGAGWGGSVSACYYGGRVAGAEAATYAASR